MIFLAPKKLWLQQQPAVQKGSLPMAIWQQAGGGDYYDDFDDGDDFDGDYDDCRVAQLVAVWQPG